MKTWLLGLLGILVCMTVKGQILEGRIMDEEGRAVEGATVYVRETAQGCVADENGEFRIALPQQVYTCEISALGYEKQTLQIKTGKGSVPVTIVLKPMTYMLQEVKVKAGGEDPAYYIMRNAIGKAPYHRQQVKRYLSEVYTKGTMRLDKVPKWLLLSKEVKKEVTPYLGKVFLLESVMDIAFEAPDRYERNILAFSSTIPEDMDPKEALGIITASIYDPEVMGLVSPLAPGAFSYYRFRFAECYLEGGKTINKIRVEPRKKNSRLVDGWMYIAENDWSVVNFDFSVQMTGTTVKTKGVFHEVKPSVFLPTSYDINVDVKLFGVRAGGKYYTSIRYKEVEADTTGTPVVRPAQAKTEGQGVQPKSPKREKTEKQLETLYAKEELTTRDAYRMARLSRQLMKAERPDTVPPLEIREETVGEKVTVDSMAVRRDSLYWLKMRTIPLKTEETLSYRLKDSLRETVRRTGGDSSAVRSSSPGVSGSLVLGGSFRMGKRVSLQVDGLLRVVPEYNFVDGFWIGQRFGLEVRSARGQGLKFTPSVYYATARKTVLWNLNTCYTYAPLRQGMLEAEFGETSADYKGNAGTLRFENALTSLVYGNNFMKFYGKRYVQLRNRIDVANGLVVTVGGHYEKRKVLENHISYNFYKKDPKPNTLLAEGGTDMPDHTSLGFMVQGSYTPRFYYRIRNGRKEYLHSCWPTFTVRYEKGIPTDTPYSSKYERLDIGLWQKIELGIFDKVSYRVLAGKFLSAREVYFPDYKQFSTTGWILSDDVFAGGFLIADYYELSTDDRWFQGTFNYASSYLLLKRLPFLQRFLFDEALHVRYLWTPVLKNYTECGYSLGLGDEIRAGVFLGFDRDGYRGIGFRIGFHFER